MDRDLMKEEEVPAMPDDAVVKHEEVPAMPGCARWSETNQEDDTVVPQSCAGSGSSHAVQAISADTAADTGAAATAKRARSTGNEGARDKRKKKNPGVTQWSAEEDKTLADAVKAQSFADGVHWVGVAAWLEGRTSDACLQRWRYSVDPTIRRGKWTPEEDEMLRQGVARHGAKGWARWVPGHMNGRTGPQCRERWVNSLDPNGRGVIEAPWSAEEDAALVEAVELLGTKMWSAVQRDAPQLQRWTDQQCKVRWVRHLEPAAASKKEIGQGMPWTDEEDKALSMAVAAQHRDRSHGVYINTETGVVDWKELHMALRPVLPRRTMHPSPGNLRTRWRTIRIRKAAKDTAVPVVETEVIAEEDETREAIVGAIFVECVEVHRSRRR